MYFNIKGPTYINEIILSILFGSCTHICYRYRHNIVILCSFIFKEI